jgi:flagellar basal body-associated protein FliL
MSNKQDLTTMKRPVKSKKATVIIAVVVLAVMLSATGVIGGPAA